MLVEGPAELFLIPPLLKKVKGIDLDREGISIIAIYGVHFDVYAKLFGKEALPKKCAIVTDGDLKPSDADASITGEDDLPTLPDLTALENEHVRVFACKTTFERALVFEETLEMFACATDDIGAHTVAKKLRKASEDLILADAEEAKTILGEARKRVLGTAKRFGKARFAQIAARHVHQAKVLPKYLVDAVEWLRAS